MAKKIIKLLSSFEYLFQPEEIEINNNFIFITKPNWDYLDCLSFQEKCADLIYMDDYKYFSVVIFTSHPSCFTLGRGLQKNLTPDVKLVDFDLNLKKNIKVPIYDIKRGGGITFHHNNQLIIYPIINLSHHKIKVYPLMSKIFKLLTSGLALQGVSDLDYCRDLLGLWSGDKKVASIGVQLRRFVSFHGVALNLDNNDEIESELLKIYPCGLPGNWYSDIKNHYSVVVNRNKLISDFKNNISELVTNYHECS
tara:strand:- start:5640 stop:6395 length:756 start_codon:yes stop_codon:yes gene_type:complete